MFADCHISCTARPIACGRPWPPNSADPAIAVPAALDELAIGARKAGRQRDLAVFELGAFLVADAVEWREDFACKAARFFQHRVDQICRSGRRTQNCHKGAVGLQSRRGQSEFASRARDRS